MSNRNPSRRSYGTGSLDVYTDAAGRESWYGRWYIGSKRVKKLNRPKARARQQGRPHAPAGRALAAPPDRDGATFP